jgi:hypothetical protein
MLDEYKTSDSFWAEAVNMACHDINRLYLHKFRHKTTYELLTGKKPNVSYFRVFGCKCFILNKKPKNSKFAPKVDEGIFLGYTSNTHSYRVLNKTIACVDVACDVTFDESNGSQVEQVVDMCVGQEESPSKAIKMTTGEIKPQEKEDDCDDEDELFDQDTAANSGESEESVETPQVTESPDQTFGNSKNFEDEAQHQGHEDLIQQDASNPHPKVCQSVQRDHPVDNILESIRRGVTTRSRLANFSGHYLFVSMIKPFTVEKALQDADWVMAMQEELNNFT